VLSVLFINRQLNIFSTTRKPLLHINSPHYRGLSFFWNYLALELLKDKCALMDQYQLGQEIIAHFNLSGRLWAAQGKPEKCFTSLQAWRIESADAGFGGSAPAAGNDFDMGGFTPSSSNFSGNMDEDVPF
jgi:hypothetical protein